MSGLSLFGSGLTITEGDGPTAYLGTWNASANTPTLASSTAPAGPPGSYYIVSTAGTTTLNGISDWSVGDWAIWSGSVWQKLDGGTTALAVGSTIVSGGASGRVLYDNAGALGVYAVTGTGSVVLANSPTITTPNMSGATTNGSTTWSSIPAAGTVGRTIFVSNAGTKGSFWFDDGTRWKPLNGVATVATLDTATSNIGTTETIALQYQLPAGLWQTGDRIRIYDTFTKSGTTDTGVLAIRIGTAGTTSDSAIISSTQLSAATRLVANIWDLRLEAATSVQVIATPSGGYGNAATTTVYPAPFTISSAAANALYVSVTIKSGGATNTVALADCQMQIISSAN